MGGWSLLPIHIAEICVRNLGDLGQTLGAPGEVFVRSICAVQMQTNWILAIPI